MTPETSASLHLQARRKRSGGIALAIVLVLVVLMITAVYGFSRRAVINATITQNRLAAAEADSAARGGLNAARAIVFGLRLTELAAANGGAPTPTADATGSAPPGAGAADELLEQIAGFTFTLQDGRTVQLAIEDLSGRLNLNSFVPQSTGSGSGPSNQNVDDSLEYLKAALRHIIDGIDARPEDKNYDVEAIAENLIDWMDADDVSGRGGSENEYYLRQDPPYSPRNKPFLSFAEIGMVEDIDAQLLEAMRDYMTIHPIGGTTGIDLNRAKPWVLPLVYAGNSGDRELLPERALRQILSARKKGKLICSDVAVDPEKCVLPADVGIEGNLYPETPLPTPLSVFRVVATAKVRNITRRMEAIYDTRALGIPQLLSWRRLRGNE